MALKKLIPHLEKVAEDLGVPGIAAIVLLPVIIPVAGKVAKPVAKATIKGGIILYEKGKGVLAEAGETFESIIAEAKAELAEASAEEMPSAELEAAAS